MPQRSFGLAAVGGCLVAVVLGAPVRVAAQAAGAARPPAPATATATPKTWTVPRTPDGQPDLQGFWNNSSYIPLQRPKDVTKAVFTKEELLAYIKSVDESEASRKETVPGTVPDVHYDFGQFGLDRNQVPTAMNFRTSLIVDPADGRLPPQTAAGQARAAARAEARKRMGGPMDAVQNQSLLVRCILTAPNGPPMLPFVYNNNYQIVQTPGYVLILVEMLHNVRMIPLDGRPPLPPTVRQLQGSSRGRWEGETLVVETTNFTDTTPFQGGSETMRVTERFTRTDENTILYRFTVDDPATWTKPWSAELPMLKSSGPLFEHACHEGNYGLYNTLAGARAEEKRAADAAAKTPEGAVR